MCCLFLPPATPLSFFSPPVGFFFLTSRNHFVFKRWNCFIILSLYTRLSCSYDYLIVVVVVVRKSQSYTELEIELTRRAHLVQTRILKASETFYTQNNLFSFFFYGLFISATKLLNMFLLTVLYYFVHCLAFMEFMLEFIFHFCVVLYSEYSLPQYSLYLRMAVGVLQAFRSSPVPKSSHQKEKGTSQTIHHRTLPEMSNPEQNEHEGLCITLSEIHFKKRISLVACDTGIISARIRTLKCQVTSQRQR